MSPSSTAPRGEDTTLTKRNNNFFQVVRSFVQRKGNKGVADISRSSLSERVGSEIPSSAQ